jgi:hypothetical protein
MRGIKFRAWDDFNKEMIQYLSIDSQGWIFSSATNSPFVMQFTGILDKNGKEIYEGDVVLMHEYNTAETVAGGADPNVVLPVTWRGTCWCYGEEPITNWIGTAAVDEFAEVVGNIHEGYAHLVVADVHDHSDHDDGKTGCHACDGTGLTDRAY